MTLRAARLLVLFVAVFATVLLAVGARAQLDATRPLEQFARQVGLDDVDGFVDTIVSLRQTGRLPARYVNKTQAERRGWRPGSDLCRSVPGGSIGGDRFNNRESALPEAARRSWREADLDYACGPRGAKRLVWSNDGLYFVTVDHYRIFRQVPK